MPASNLSGVTCSPCSVVLGGLPDGSRVLSPTLTLLFPWLGPWSILPVHSGPGLRLPAVVVVSHSATGWKRGAAESVSGWSRWRRLTGSSPSRVRHNPRVDCTWKWVHRPRPDHFRAGNQGLHSRSRESAPNSARGRRGGASRKACRPVTARAAEPRPTPISEQPHMARRPAVLDVAQAEHQIQVIL